MVAGKNHNSKTKPRQAPKKPDKDAKKQAEAKAADAKAETKAKPAAKNGVGHNSGEVPLTADQKQALFFRHVRERKPLMETLNKAVSALRNYDKRVKAEGGSVRKIKYAIQLETPEGEAAMKAQIEEMAEVAVWMGATQMEMFGLPDRTPSVDRAHAQGRAAGFAGEKPESWGGGHDPHTAQYQRWIEGYREAQASYAKSFLTPIEKAAKAGAATDVGDEEATHAEAE